MLCYGARLLLADCDVGRRLFRHVETAARTMPLNPWGYGLARTCPWTPETTSYDPLAPCPTAAGPRPVDLSRPAGRARSSGASRLRATAGPGTSPASRRFPVGKGGAAHADRLGRISNP